MGDWYYLGGLAAGAALLAGRALIWRKHQDSAADASGLTPVRDLTHVPAALQRTALWSLSEGGFERRVLHGVLSRGAEDVDVTAFDLETLRERRGEWAYLPVVPPFRIAGTVSIVVCEIDRVFPHCVLKRIGRGDEMRDDDMLERGANIAKIARDGLGMGRSYPAEMPASLDTVPLEVGLADHWRAYGRDKAPLATLVAGGFNAALQRADRRDLVIELIDNLVIVYPAAREVVGADAFADLTTTALTIVDGVLAGSPRITPRGVESRRAG
ncbi:MAG: hypothetical protein H0T89_35320 [Deltaproteobacteria bacterium]|nr:hypothetical protein [Deltaproteobacteria bacterium]MDQ3298460.1 hypothetical protein [Myxococcota bacterium]